MTSPILRTRLNAASAIRFGEAENSLTVVEGVSVVQMKGLTAEAAANNTQQPSVQKGITNMTTRTETHVLWWTTEADDARIAKLTGDLGSGDAQMRYIGPDLWGQEHGVEYVFDERQDLYLAPDEADFRYPRDAENPIFQIISEGGFSGVLVPQDQLALISGLPGLITTTELTRWSGPHPATTAR